MNEASKAVDIDSMFILYHTARINAVKMLFRKITLKVNFYIRLH